MSKIILKKNGTDYLFGLIPLHYPADRVYLDGDTTKNVQDAIDEVNDNKVSKSGDTMRGQLNIDRQNGTASTVGGSQIWLGNDISEGTAKNSRGILRLYGKNSFYAEIYDDIGLTAHRSITLPNKSGTLATTSDIPTDFVSKASGGTFSGTLTINRTDGTTSSIGGSYLVLGNDIPEGTANNSRGNLRIYGNKQYYGQFKDNNNLTANREYYLPDKNGTFAMTSDISSRKFKENINPLSTEEANKILDVEVVTFDYKDGVCGEDERYNNRGVIAEQVEPIISYVVEHSTEDEEEVLRVDYRKFIPYLIKVVQNQQTEIDNLKAEIERIKEAK